MAKCDCSAVDIYARPIPVKFFAICQGLSGKSFVDFDEVKVTDFEACTLQETIDSARGRGKDIAGRDGG